MANKGKFTCNAMPVGAEIRDLDLAQSIDEATANELNELWLEHGVLIFRGEPVTNEQHLRLSRCFGEIQRHPMPELWAEGEPYLIALGGKATNMPPIVYDGTELLAGRIPWHRDTAYVPEICAGAMLRLVDIPEEGGETCFADTEHAYNNLPEELKERIENLEFKATLRVGSFSQSRLGAFWRSVRFPTKQEWPHPFNKITTGEEAVDRYPPVVHPVVMRHPVTGRKCIYFSPTYVDEFLGLSMAESEILLAELVGYMLDPSVTYVHNWKPGDLVIWDNRRMMHAALGHHPKYERRGLRSTLKDSLHSGRYYDVPKSDFKRSALIKD